MPITDQKTTLSFPVGVWISAIRDLGFPIVLCFILGLLLWRTQEQVHKDLTETWTHLAQIERRLDSIEQEQALRKTGQDSLINGQIKIFDELLRTHTENTAVMAEVVGKLNDIIEELNSFVFSTRRGRNDPPIKKKTRKRTMGLSREQALRDYEDAGKMIDQLIDKRNNLRKIIFSEVLTPQIVRKSALNVQTSKPGNGKTQEVVLKALVDHGGELTSQEIADLIEYRYMQVSPAVHKLHNRHLVNRRQTREGKYLRNYWSSAIHKDKSELNHL